MAWTRQRIQAERISAHYSCHLHIACLLLTTVGLGIYAAWRARTSTAVDGLAFGGMLVFLNLGEYLLHRFPFHNKIGPGITYFRHTTMHHSFFTHETMPVDSWRDMRWVLLPPFVVPGVLLILSPSLWLLHRADPNLMWLLVLAVCVYVAVYETLHTLSHLPKTTSLSTNPVILAITEHHRIHHDPKLMRKYNFNFGFPLFDWLFGTRYRGNVS